MNEKKSRLRNLSLVVSIVSAFSLAQLVGVTPTSAFDSQSKGKGGLRPAAATFTVNSTADTPDANPGDCVCADAGANCTLRAAIMEANACAGFDNIAFNIGTGTPTIAVGSGGNGPLPALTEPFSINGATGGATRVELNGTAAGGDGLTINTGLSQVTSLVINRFSGNGIVLTGIGGGGGGNTISNSYIGTDSTGALDLGNGLNGVFIPDSPDNRLNSNVISGNSSNGVFIGSASVGNLLTNNFIGTNAAGTGPLGNVGAAVVVQGPSNNITSNTLSANNDGVILVTGTASANVVVANFIGTNSAGANLGNNDRGIQIAASASNNLIDSNIIAFNGASGATTRAGVSVEGGTGNSITANSIHDNVGLGIDLLPVGVTPNDNCDPDAGPNNLQNFPNLATASSDLSSTFVGGNINSTPNTTFTIDFFSNTTCDPSLNGEGDTYLGSISVTTDANCVAGFEATLPQPSPIGSFITATATNQTTSDTSEFSNCQTVLAPSAVEFAGMSATTYDGATLLEWRTGFEVSNLGFNLYRDLNGKRTRINPSILAGSALITGPATALTAGQSYKWVDYNADDASASSYWLEDIDINGARSWHGPFSPRSAGGKLPRHAPSLTLSSLHSETASHPAGAPSDDQSYSVSTRAHGSAMTPISVSPAGARAPDNRLKTQWELAASPAVKISIRDQGWYGVGQADLLAAGLSPDSDPRLLRLFANGQELPMVVSAANKNRFEPGDSIQFYATGLDTASTDARLYWLVAGTQPGKRINPAQNSGASPATARSFPMTVQRKERSVYFSALKNGEAENFFGPVITKQAVSQSLNVRNLDPEADGVAQLEVALQGVTDQPDLELDHTVSVSFNGADVGSLSLAGRGHKDVVIDIPHNSIREGDNVVTLAARGEMDVTLLDYVRLTYRHTYKADSDALDFTAEGGESVKVGGFSSPSLLVVDVTDPDSPQTIEAETASRPDGFEAAIAVPGAGRRVLMAVGGGGVRKASSVVANRPSQWNRKNQKADLVIISHRDFIGRLGPLVGLRQREGLSVAVVDVEDIYDEFSYGAHGPMAVRDFLSGARGSWKRPPRFVMLVGDASSDPRDYLGQGGYDYVPTKLVDTTYMETASDDWLADFDGDGLAEMSVGRLPARTGEEAAAMVAKIVGYEESEEGRGVLLVSDEKDQFDFEASSRQLSQYIPAGVKVGYVSRGGGTATEVKRRLMEGMSEGPKVVNYQGHGSIEQWKGDLLTASDAWEVRDGRRLPFIIAMTCLNGYFQDPVLEGLGETLMKREKGGAVAVWGSSAMTEPDKQGIMNREAFRLMFSGTGVRGARLGEITTRAKEVVNDRGFRLTWILLGDPSMRLK
jgi:CSLREA domain-containing protein